MIVKNKLTSCAACKSVCVNSNEGLVQGKGVAV